MLNPSNRCVVRALNLLHLRVAAYKSGRSACRISVCTLNWRFALITLKGTFIRSMQCITRFAPSSLTILAVLCLLPVGCGYGTNATTGVGVATSILISPAMLSLNAGQVVQIFPELLDGTGAQITNNIVFTYTATGSVQVSTTGLVCA